MYCKYKYVQRFSKLRFSRFEKCITKVYWYIREVRLEDQGKQRNEAYLLNCKQLKFILLWMKREGKW